MMRHLATGGCPDISALAALRPGIFLYCNRFPIAAIAGFLLGKMRQAQIRYKHIGCIHLAILN